jgi:hypothetical protein
MPKQSPSQKWRLLRPAKNAGLATTHHKGIKNNLPGLTWCSSVALMPINLCRVNRAASKSAKKTFINLRELPFFAV